MGEGRRTETAAAGEETSPHPEITLREISAWSLAILAAVALGFVLYAASRGHAAGRGGFRGGRHAGPGGAKTRKDCTFRARSSRSSWWRASRWSSLCGSVDFSARVRAHERLAGHRRVVEGKAARVRWPGRGVAAAHRNARRAQERRCGCVVFARDFLGSLDDLGSVAADYGISVLSRRASFVHLRMAELAARPSS